MIFNGNNLIVKVGIGTGNEAVIACATSCSLSINQESIEASCKSDTYGKWVQSIPGKANWDLSTDNLYDPTFTNNSFDKLAGSIIADANGTATNEFLVIFEISNDVSASGDVETYTGSVQLTDISLSGPADDKSTFTANFKGIGALVQNLKA